MATQCATEVDDNPLWNFALQFYASKDAQQQLLTLQNDYQQDTLLILTALWLGNCGHGWPVSEQSLQPYLQWREQVIGTLRITRKAIAKENTSAAVAALRQQIQKDEIRAEQIALHMLYRLCPDVSRQKGNPKQALYNLLQQAQWLSHTGIKKETLRPLFQQLVQLL